ncbi:MAG: sulfatase-like hydrolase/transferase [Candidatus Aminicenantes bacterium]|nr:sulfatase-like hydrolase/transferase [Candidatus Aminicenantes bacterium]
MIDQHKGVWAGVLITSLFWILFSLQGCPYLKQSPPQYIFLITLDTTRADHIHYSLEENTLTPNLAVLASQGIYFSNAYSLIPITLPSHLSMFYSLPPHILRVYNNGEINLSPLPSLEKILKNNGYNTGAVISLGTVSLRWGIGTDFDHYIENFRKPYLWYKTGEHVNEDAFTLINQLKHNKTYFWIHYSDPHSPYFTPEYKGEFSVSLNGEKKFVSKSTERALVELKLTLKPGQNILKLDTEVPKQIKQDKDLNIEWIEYEDFSITPLPENRNPTAKFPREWIKESLSNSVNFRTHQLNSSIELQNKGTQNIKTQLYFVFKMVPTVKSTQILYRKEVQYMDECIGKLIDFLKKNGFYKDSAFVIMGDHGEGLGEYQNHVGHIHFLNKCFVQTPLIISGKNIRKQGIRKELASNLDIAPTILDMAQIKKPEFMMGDSLLNPLKNQKLLLETYAPEARGNAFSIINFPYQIIVYPYRDQNKLELIDLTADKLGVENLMNHQGLKLESKYSLIKDVQEKAQQLSQKRENKPKISEIDEDILKSLGYIK